MGEDNRTIKYEPPRVVDLGTLIEITASGVNTGPKEGVNLKT